MTVLPDVLARDLDVVFCGTAVGRKSAERRAYYAGPGNAFWRTLHDAGFTPVQLAPEQYKKVKTFGLGLTDLAKHKSGSDSVLARGDFSRNALIRKIRKYRPRILAFTSKRAASEFLGRRAEYGLLPEKVGETALFVVTSPSGAARRYWDSGRWWHELSKLRRSRCVGA